MVLLNPGTLPNLNQASTFFMMPSQDLNEQGGQETPALRETYALVALLEGIRCIFAARGSRIAT